MIASHDPNREWHQQPNCYACESILFTYKNVSFTALLYRVHLTVFMLLREDGKHECPLKIVTTCCHVLCSLQKTVVGASLVAQWLRISLPVQGTRLRALVREDPTCRGATKPVHHTYWASTASTACKPHLLSPCATTTEACAPRARALQQEKPPQWEARAPQQGVAPAHRN